ncbi:MAG: hypothetical protein JW986_04480 [Methanotrichaceae archaeon]|nr:hypothetical protein [Methanotrichaceae archaeon]
MIAYTSIAEALESASRAASRREKIQPVTELVSSLDEGELCPSIRLLMGELWPSWAGREMGTGIEAVMDALEELAGTRFVSDLQGDIGEVGAVAEKAIEKRSQSVLSSQSLTAMDVYKALSQISRQSGRSSRGRRSAILRGLFLEATPLEGKYIARTLDGNMRVGLGPSLVCHAIALAIGMDPASAKEAYQLLPEMGLLALALRDGRAVEVTPEIPVRFMVPSRRAKEPPSPGLYQIRYGGLRVQLHLHRGGFRAYSGRLRDISRVLRAIEDDILTLPQGTIFVGELLGFKDGRLIGQGELLSFLNGNSRHSSIAPSIKVADLLLLKGRDLISLPFSRRWEEARALLSPAEDLPYPPFSLAETRDITRTEEVVELLSNVMEIGLAGLIMRDPQSSYRPGATGGDSLVCSSGRAIFATVLQAEDGVAYHHMAGKGRRNG